MTLSRDPIINAINNGIKRDIDITVENDCGRAAIILIYSAIDAMANINRPEAQKYNTSTDFKDWVSRYFCIEGETKITPEEWWAARNATVHTYGIFARDNIEKNTRCIGYIFKSPHAIRYNEAANKNFVLVDVIAMKEALFGGIDKFLIDSFSIYDEKKKNLTEKRLKDLIIVIGSNELKNHT